MFQLVFGPHRSCDGLTRRDVLRVGSLTALGMTLPGLLRAQAASGGRPERDDFSCILLWLQGGMSHIDSFDPKPDAPSEIRGEFSAIDTAVPGIRLCEPLPLLAACQDRYSIVRSLNPKNGSHGTADAYMLSGHPFTPAMTFPSYGSVIAKERGDRNQMPPYVQVGTAIDQRFGGGVAGYLGDRHNPFVLPGDPSRSEYRVRDVSMTASVDRERFGRRMKALETVDTWQSQLEGSSNALDAADAFYSKAYRLITTPEAKRAFEIDREDPRLRDRYGRHSLGQGCLMARRLIDAGVRFVTVTDGGWDTHTNNFKSLKDRLLPRLDQALSALLNDLHGSGRLERTLVVCLSDFGRTPMVNPSAGRDHWSTASVALMAGAGLKPGVAVGETNAMAEQPIDAPYYTEDIAATIYDRLGIPLDTMHQAPDGRPIRVNYDGRVIRELL